MTRKILCTTDGTDHSTQAVIHAAEMAVRYGAPLTACIVNVVHGGTRGPTINHWSDADIQKYLAEAAELAGKHGATDVRQVDIICREVAGAIAES